MSDVKLCFESFPSSSNSFLENLVNDYDYGGGFDSQEITIKTVEGNFLVEFISNKKFSLDEDIEDNLLDTLIGRGNFFSHLYFSLDDLKVNEDEIKINVEVDGNSFSVDLGKDCELIPTEG